MRLENTMWNVDRNYVHLEHMQFSGVFAKGWSNASAVCKIIFIVSMKSYCKQSK